VMSNRFAVEGSMWQPLELNCDGATLMRDMPWKYCSAEHRAAPEPRTTYCGFVCFGSISAAGGTWDLWTEYDVEFRSPCLDVDTTINVLTPTAFSSLASCLVASTGTSAAAYPYMCTIPPLTGPGAGFPVLKTVVSGANGTPVMATTLQAGAARIGCTAWDLIDILRNGGGLLDFATLLSLTGRVPSTQLPLSQYQYLVEHFTDNGTLIGAPQSTGTAATFSPDNPTQWGTASAWVQGHGSWSFSPSTILAYPGLRYLIVSLVSQSVNDAAAGNFGSNWRLKL
jgi:hypothetical protein